MQDDPGMKFLNGFKTILGAAGMVLTFVAPKIVPAFSDAAPHAINIAQGAFGLLLALGIIHKSEKTGAK